MTNPASFNNDHLHISLLQRAGEPDIPYAQRVFRAGWEAAMAANSAHPPAITSRLPRPEECDAKARVWVWCDESATDPPGWDLVHLAAVIEALQTMQHRLRWRPATSLPLEVGP